MTDWVMAVVEKQRHIVRWLRAQAPRLAQRDEGFFFLLHSRASDQALSVIEV